MKVYVNGEGFAVRRGLCHFYHQRNEPLKTPQTRPLFLCREQSHRSALARHAGHGLRSLHKEFGTCPSAVHGACRSAVSACAETTSLCPDFPLDPHTSNFILSQDARHNRLTSCLQGHPKTALMGCPCKRQPSHASQPPLRCGCLRYVLRALPLINRGAGWTVLHSAALLKVYRLRLSAHY